MASDVVYLHTWRARGQRSWLALSGMLLITLCSFLAVPVEGVAGPALRGVASSKSEGELSFRPLSDYEGVDYASFAGGMTIEIKGTGLAENPQSNLIYLESQDFGNSIPAPLLSQADAFKSSPRRGSLSYELPSLQELLMMPQENFKEHYVLTFYLSVRTEDGQQIECQKRSNCKVVYRRSYTPSFFYLSPRVVFESAQTEVWFDPRSTSNLISNLEPGEKPFGHFKLNQTLLDFSEAEDTDFRLWSMNVVRGRVHQAPLGNHLAQMAWDVGLASTKNNTAMHCTFDESDCYFAKVIPVIQTINSHSGFSTGRQLLEISGNGFASEKVSVKIGGAECQVKSSTKTKVVCETGSSSNILSTESPQVGLNGISVFTYSKEHPLPEDLIKKEAKTEFESFYSIQAGASSIYKGWFVPPTTARYRFYMACDHNCTLRLGSMPLDLDSIKEIITIASPTERRDYFSLMGEGGSLLQLSAWQTMVKDQPYFIEGSFVEKDSADFFTVSVEIEGNRTTPHHNPLFESQIISLQPETSFEKTEFTVKDIGLGQEFFIVFTDDELKERFFSEMIVASVGTTEEEFKEAIASYYLEKQKVEITVTRTLLDARGEPTTDETAAASMRFVVQLKKLIKGFSVSNIQIAGDASVEVLLPQTNQASSPPLSGNLRVKCVHELGDAYYSDEFAYSWSANSIKDKIMTGCSFLDGSIQVRSTDRFEFPENGRELFLTFRGFRGDPGQFELQLAPGNPLSAVQEQRTVSHYNPKNIFYEPIPFELLRTFETMPQVSVEVDGLPAVCASLDCGYTYQEPEGLVKQFSYDASSKVLEIEGDLPLSSDLIRTIRFAQADCKISSVSPSKLVCLLEADPTCGKSYPEVYTFNGLVPVAADLEKEEIPCTMISIDKISGLNLLGGDNLTFTGLNFPQELQNSQFELIFMDSQQTKCPVVETSSRAFTCRTERFNFQDRGKSFGITIKINGLLQVFILKFTLADQIFSIQNISPISVSPVLNSLLTFELSPAFSESLEDGQISVTISNILSPEDKRILLIKEIDPAAKSFKAQFRGAPSGEYIFEVRHAVIGLLDSMLFPLEVGARIEDISIKEISPYGGTLIKITGNNFGEDPSDYAVDIRYNGGVGSADCLVEESSPTMIACRVETGLTREAGSLAQLAVTLKEREEAKCDPVVCRLAFAKEMPTITEVEAYFDNTDLQQKLKVVGTDFSGSLEGTLLEVDGVKQTTLSLQPTEALFALHDIPQDDLTGLMKLTFAIGVPAGHDTIDETSVKLAPFLVAVNPSSGSVGGTLLIAQVKGVGPGSSNITLVTSGNEDICQEVTIEKPGELRCLTKPLTRIDSELSVLTSSEVVSCGNPDASLCEYTQDDQSGFPVLLSAKVNQANEVDVEGLNFDFDPLFTAQASFAGVNASSVVVNGPQKMTLRWANGIPVTSGPSELKVFFFDSTGVVHHAYSQAQIQNPLAGISSSEDLECGFAGGCLLEVKARGVADLFEQFPDENFIEVCGKLCQVQPDYSSSSGFSCLLPEMPTKFSYDMHGVGTKPQVLDSGAYFGEADADLLWSGELEDPVEGDDSCVAGMAFSSDETALPQSVRFYLAELEDFESYSGLLRFEGSNDQSIWSTLFVTDEFSHEGWNTFRWQNERPEFRFFRFASEFASCFVVKAELTGARLKTNSDSELSCKPVLVMGQETREILDEVTYLSDLTPTIKAISPTTGSVKGGTNIEFSGENLPDDPTLLKVEIDGVPCRVVSSNETAFACITGPRPSLSPSSLDVSVEGQGQASFKGEVSFTYTSPWTDEDTWGEEPAPEDGDSIYVPEGLNLLVDTEKSPNLNAVIVEGSLIFPRTQNCTFDASYILVNEGKLEAGTESQPLESNLEITLHGSPEDPYLPLFGNKVLAVRAGEVNLHGKARQPAWTVLARTADQGDAKITVKGEVDWKVGEWIAIASTSSDGSEAEERQIKAIDLRLRTKPTLTLNEPLRFRHLGTAEYLGGVARPNDFIEKRAEVALLSRNLVIRGNPEEGDYGATFSAQFSEESKGSIKVEGVEFKNSGQVSMVGKSPILVRGTSSPSYVKGVSIHRSSNRMISLLETKNFLLKDNVGLSIEGHGISILNGENNQLTGNCLINVRRSMSLLPEDQNPSAFLIGHPSNEVIGNSAAGSEGFGFKYSLPLTSTTSDICPRSPITFLSKENSAHASSKAGLVITGREGSSSLCETDEDDPGYSESAISYDLEKFKLWENAIGVKADVLGQTSFSEFKVFDNLETGIEIRRAAGVGEGSSIQDSLIVGRSFSASSSFEGGARIGIATPGGDNFIILSTSFYAFDQAKGDSVIATCSSCVPGKDSGLSLLVMNHSYFDASVSERVLQNPPSKTIIFDKDGSLSERDEPTWITQFASYLNFPEECTLDEDLFDSALLCDDSQSLRTVTLFNQEPSMAGTNLSILPLDDELLQGMTFEEQQAYIDDPDNYSKIQYSSESPSGFVAPFLTGHKYKVAWEGDAIENLTISSTAEAGEALYLIITFNEVKEAIKVYDGQVKVENNSIPEDWATVGKNGQHLALSDQIHFIVTGDAPLRIETFSCVTDCEEPAPEPKQTESFTRKWSDPKNWPGEQLPAEGDEVFIRPEWNMVFDLPETPVLSNLEIMGILSFDDTADRTLQAEAIAVRGGELFVGDEADPFNHKAEIILHERKPDSIGQSSSLLKELTINNAGTVKMFGKPRSGIFSRLTKPASLGSKYIMIEPSLDLKAGDEIALVSSSYGANLTDTLKVVTYSEKTGAVIVDGGLSYYHWGSSTSTSNEYGVDFRCEVLLLSRKIRIRAADGLQKGVKVLTTDIIDSGVSGEAPLVDREGQLILDNVEISRASDSVMPAVRFYGALEKPSKITNSVLHNGEGWGLQILNSKAIELKNNIFFSFSQIGVTIDGANDVVFDSNVVAKIIATDEEKPRGGVLACTLLSQRCTGIQVTNNLVAGASFAGFTTRAHVCGTEATQLLFRGNIAHSIDGRGGGYGVVVEKDPYFKSHSSCMAASHFTAYKCSEQALATYEKTKKVHISHFVSFENSQGLTAALATGHQGYGDFIIQIDDSLFLGESELEDCPIVGGKPQGFCFKFDKFGLTTATATLEGKTVHPKQKALPFYKQASPLAWDLRIQLNRNRFHGFDSKTRQGKWQAALALNAQNTWDGVFIHEFYDTELKNIREGALAWLEAPAEERAVPELCGDLSCSGPLNAMLAFRRTKFRGPKPTWASADFEIISNNEQFASNLKGCDLRRSMNAYICDEDSLGLLQFESNDEDRRSRDPSPVTLSFEGLQITNKLNSFKDSTWDGLYLQQQEQKLDRFFSLVYAPRGSVMNITYTGEPPQNQTFKLTSLSKSVGVTIRIAYPTAQSLQVTKNDDYIPMNSWNENLQTYGTIRQRFCGENRFVGVKNLLEFYISAGCELKIAPRNAIQTMVRLEWTMEEFYADGGTTKFIDRLVGLLRIETSSVKIVSVYTGSLVVNYEIVAATKESLAVIESRQVDLFATAKMDLGAPVLDTVIGEVMVVSDGIVTAPGFKPIIITQTESNQGYNPNSGGDIFNPNVNVTFENSTVPGDKPHLNNSTKGGSVVYTEVDNKISTIIVTVAIMLFCFVLCVGGYKYCSYQKEKDLLDAKIIRQKHEQFEAEAKQRGEGKHHPLTQRSEFSVSRNLELSKLSQGYESQFDPQNDFVIFKSGDMRKSKSKPTFNEADLFLRKQLTIPVSSDQGSSVGRLSPEASVASGANSPNMLLSPQGGLKKMQLPEDQEIVSEGHPSAGILVPAKQASEEPRPVVALMNEEIQSIPRCLNVEPLEEEDYASEVASRDIGADRSDIGTSEVPTTPEEASQKEEKKPAMASSDNEAQPHQLGEQESKDEESKESPGLHEVEDL